LNSYAIAFGILGLGISVAVLLWSRPRIGRLRQVRRFRRELAHVDVVSRWWSQSLRNQIPSDDVPTPLPELRRTKRGQRRNGRAGEGDALV
jgi:hypothetical protein